MTSSNMKWLNPGDLFVVQADPNDTSTAGYSQLGKYSAAQLQEDITQLVSNVNVSIHIAHSPPPYPGDPGGVGVNDLWFDSSIHAIFIMTRTAPANVGGQQGYVWVIVTPSDRAKLLTNLPLEPVEFPHDPGQLIPPNEYIHKRTKVHYYYNPGRNQWFDIFTPAEDSIIANRDSIEILDDKVEDRVKTAGDTMTGDLFMDGADILVDGGDVLVDGAVVIRANDTSNGNSTAIFNGDHAAVYKTLEVSASGNEKVNFTDSTNCDISKSGDWFVSLQSDQIKLSKNLHMSSQKITNLATCTSNNDAANKKYVDDKVVGVVEQYNSNTPPSSRSRGSLLMTDNNQLYIYTG